MRLARISVIRGQHKEAMEFIKQMDRHSLKPMWFIVVMEHGPYLQEIRSDKDFSLILNTIKSTWQKEHDKVQVWLEENDVVIN